MYYVDTSALVKLVVAEAGSSALRAWIPVGRQALITSDLARTELARAVLRAAPERTPRVRDVLDSLAVLHMSRDLFDTARRLQPVTLRSLDALHLAAALSLGDDLEGLVTYDERMGDAASLAGIAVIAP